MNKSTGRPPMADRAARRTRPLTANMSPAEADAIRKLADDAGLTVSDFLRRLALRAIAATNAA